mmetsp:Transcript_1892/g.1929  ORF Transcript_1892/g.1929 Transcript_1892/m.1929 type:complete len:329 (+) Transcript_1892:11-997(+)
MKYGYLYKRTSKVKSYPLYQKNLMFVFLVALIFSFSISPVNSVSEKLSSTAKIQAQSQSTSTSNSKAQGKNRLKSLSQSKAQESLSNKNNLSSDSAITTKMQVKQDFITSGNSIFPVPGDPCPCASSIPACCTPEFDSFQCDCISKPVCGACSSDNLNAFSTFHDSMLKMAMKDAFNQQDLAQKAKLQVELFQKAQDFAKEVGIQEMKAKQYAKVLNEATRKAQISRAMMFQAASQVRLLADKTLRAITPMRCSGPKCGAALNPVINAYNPQPALNTIRQKLNTLSSMNYPTMNFLGNINGGYEDMRGSYLRSNSYNGNSRETAYGSN